MKTSLLSVAALLFTVAACQPAEESTPEARPSPSPYPPAAASPVVPPVVSNVVAADAVPKPATGWPADLLAKCKAAGNTFCDSDSWPKANYDALMATAGTCQTMYVNVSTQPDDCLNLRPDAAFSGSPLECLPRGTSVCVKGQSGEASIVNVNGKDGFMKASMLSSSNPGGASTQPVATAPKDQDVKDGLPKLDCAAGYVTCKAKGEGDNRRCFQQTEKKEGIQWFDNGKVVERLSSGQPYCFSYRAFDAKPGGWEHSASKVLPYRALQDINCVVDATNGIDCPGGI